MKTKFFFLLAALLLNVCAFAQSENTTPLKGDVNNDGTVDVADINAVIEIMKNGGGTGEETKYYWYAGTTEPTTSNITSIGNSLSDKPTTWTAQNPKSIEATNDTGSSSYIYYCFPTNWNVVVLDSDKISEMLLADVSTFTLNNTQYTVKRTGRMISNGTTKPYYAKLD